jgi:hypothetical protein
MGGGVNGDLHFKDIFREFEAFLINAKVIQRLRGFLNTFLVELRLF